MDFDTSKENIQPLRGGRNVTQLGVALQAQHNPEVQQDLMQQKSEFENAIRTYTGDDPLANYYQYISWIDQVYPKNGHESNVVPILEDCVRKFEHDDRYKNDSRFCKILNKFIDMQQNPIEIYHMLFSKDICKGCADLYKGWAYYYEVNGDFRNANAIFKLGISELAQPVEDLFNAQHSMVFAAGQQVINGVDESRLNEQRQALTMLKPIRPGRVGSVRTVAADTPGLLPSADPTTRPNASVQVYNDQSEVVLGAGAPPISILSVVKRDAPKENIMKPGVWTNSRKKGSAAAPHKVSHFTVHEDDGNDSPESLGIRLPTNFFPVTHQDFSEWKVSICFPDPDDPNKIPMYCKTEVYIDPMTEYSPEEVRARRYLIRSRLSNPYMETEQAVQSIMGDEMDHSMQEIHDEPPNLNMHGTLPIHQPHLNIQEPNHSNNLPHMSIHEPIQNQHLSMHEPQQTQHSQLSMHEPQQSPHPHLSMNESIHSQQINQSIQQIHDGQLYPQLPAMTFGDSHHMNNEHQHRSMDTHGLSYNNMQSHRSFIQQQNETLRSPHIGLGNNSPIQQPPMLDNNGSRNWPQINPFETTLASQQSFEIWSPTESNVQPIQKPQVSAFPIFEETGEMLQTIPKMQAKACAMKTPFKVLTDDDLAETGSRGGLDSAAAAQPVDGAKRLAMFDHDDDSSSGLAAAPPAISDLNGTNTTLFNLNLFYVSTPENKQQNLEANAVDPANVSVLKKELFPPDNKLSVIYEELSSTSGATAKSLPSAPRSLDKIEEEDKYRAYLSQNLKVNEALRQSSLANLMEFDSQPDGYDIDEVDDDNEDLATIVYDEGYVPYPVLPNAPSDPFKADVISKLLNHVEFPGRHRNNHVLINSAPRLAVKKDACYVGNDRFIVDKLLGKGTYGSVFKGNRPDGQVVALKIQKPPNKWEYYICRELQSRLVAHELQFLQDRFMNVEVGYFNESTSVLLSEYSPYGSLLDLSNLLRAKRGKQLSQNLCIYLTIEMIDIIHAMHKVKIIHADIKPDNFLVMLRANNTIQLQLIDFGCSIDMSLYPEGTTFTRAVTTDNFICCEMRDGRRWSYHTDLFCLAATTHVLLFEKYIVLKKTPDNMWTIAQKFTRYWNSDLWTMYFYTLLNMQDGFPDLNKLKEELKNAISMVKNLDIDMREVLNVLKGR
ncbi:PREDICTED: mitotic checkpoint serine/threonine-protein kinase BUB1-like [Nicrophorus vespilloides]|uniref:Mitotic checkpoint serine/threonine-protein kinase BUB1-like n=1 Tax=Nicrophorus vespilloides TaxID=110193 RepID=A0ABM1MPL9_NICVS|nr:PREDICTED: mitotic checkpoint serine/threonine-protein kinase BUB1-like [Nicrophorus vespilloides]